MCFVYKSRKDIKFLSSKSVHCLCNEVNSRLVVADLISKLETKTFFLWHCCRLRKKKKKVGFPREWSSILKIKVKAVEVIQREKKHAAVWTGGQVVEKNSLSIMTHSWCKCNPSYSHIHSNIIIIFIVTLLQMLQLWVHLLVDLFLVSVRHVRLLHVVTYLRSKDS